MKTTLDLPDDLMRAVKIRAAEENRRLKDLVAELLRKGLGLAANGRTKGRKRVRLPIIQCAHRALPDTELTPERVAQILLQGETEIDSPSVR